MFKSCLRAGNSRSVKSSGMLSVYFHHVCPLSFSLNVECVYENVSKM